MDAGTALSLVVSGVLLDVGVVVLVKVDTNFIGRVSRGWLGTDIRDGRLTFLEASLLF